MWQRNRSDSGVSACGSIAGLLETTDTVTCSPNDQGLERFWMSALGPGGSPDCERRSRQWALCVAMAWSVQVAGWSASG
jgi:hypothetical protein